jgi:hypothetical protein
MAEIDTSIYKPQPPSGIGAMNPTQLIDLVQRGRQLQSDIAVSDAYRNNYDPTHPTGVNLQGLVRDIAQSPTGAQRLPEEVSRVTHAAQGGFNLSAGQTKFVQDMMGTLANKPDLSHADFFHAAAIASRNGVPQQLIAPLLQDLPRDQAGLRARAVTFGNMAAGYAGGMSELPAAPSPGGEARTIPAGRAAYDATGATAPPSVAPVPAAPAGRTVGAPMGSGESSTLMQRDFGRAAKFNDEMVPLTSALKAVEKLGPGGTAPGAKGRQEFASFIYGMAPTLTKWLPGLDPEKLKNFAEADKYLTQAVMGRAASFGHGTDMALATTASGNPNVNINDLAVKDVLKMSIALRRMEHAQTLDSAKAGPMGYSSSSAKWATGQDPRAYMLDMMTKDQIAKLDKELKGKSREKFNNSLRSAIESGAITPPGGG